MKLITDSKDLTRTISQLMSKHKEMDWAVAWASTHNPIFKLLTESKNKIGKMVIGTHFYQTDPEFIEYWINDKRVRFVLATDGVFHPKVYLFGNESKWDCVIGSANFTKGAFSANDEACIHLCDTDLGSEKIFREVQSLIHDYWERSYSLTTEYIVNYRRRHAANRSALAKLEGRYGRKPRTPSQLTIAGLNWTWDEYLAEVTKKNNRQHTYLEAIRLTEAAFSLFKSKNHFSEFSKVERSEIAGFNFSQRNEVHWAIFGSMKGAGYFKQLINNNDTSVSNALDQIPSSGPIVREDWLNYVKGISGLQGINIGTATRLVTLKRPDYFVSVTSAARKNLAKQLNIPAGSFSKENYWDQVIEPIKDTPWWNSREPKDPQEGMIWRARAAMLDMILYEPRK